jgi:hypothetical protein
MPTIADEIRAWARQHLFNHTVISSNTEVHNHLTLAIEKLLHLPWTQAPTTAVPSSTAATKAFAE